MKKQYQTIDTGGSAEITEKKSRFIANVFPVEEEEEALAILEQMRKKYWDARHNCWAYVVGVEQVTARCSDDGEPAQTAGKPILDVITGLGLHNVLVVVTRYFGGVLLGTGGLVRAYSKASQEGLAHSRIITRKLGIKLTIHTDYNGIGKIQYLLGKREIKPLDTLYTDAVQLKVVVPESEKGALEAEITESTAGKAVIEKEGMCWLAEVDGSIKIKKNVDP